MYCVLRLTINFEGDILVEEEKNRGTENQNRTPRKRAYSIERKRKS